jgi:hypothetical protein
MKEKEMKSWIDNADYMELLGKWRFAPVGSPWFQGELGDYYVAAMEKRRLETSQKDQVAISKSIGWQSA